MYPSCFSVVCATQTTTIAFGLGLRFGALLGTVSSTKQAANLSLARSFAAVVIYVIRYLLNIMTAPSLPKFHISPGLPGSWAVCFVHKEY